MIILWGVLPCMCVIFVQPSQLGHHGGGEMGGGAQSVPKDITDDPIFPGVATCFLAQGARILWVLITSERGTGPVPSHVTYWMGGDTV